MRDAQGIALHLAAWAGDERAAQEQTLEALEEQERAVRARDLEAVDAAVARLQQISERGAARGRRRDQLLSDLSKVWGVPRAALTLGSVVERLGDDGAALAELRRELRQGAAEVLRATRRVAVLVGALRRVSGEVIELLLTDEDGAPLHGGGALVDAEV